MVFKKLEEKVKFGSKLGDDEVVYVVGQYKAKLNETISTDIKFGI